MNMRKLLLAASRDVTTCYYTFLILSLLAVNVAGRYLHDNTRELDVDGISGHTQPEQSSFLRLKGMDYSEEYYCSEQMYGFLPCSSTLVGHFFLIVVYEYLLFQGESLVISGGSRLFEILGPGVFGASAFPVLDPLPESLIVLVSGLVASKEEAQEYVKTGVGLLTGSTIFLLTLLWGTCVIVGSQKFHSNPIQSRQSSLPWSGSGVITDVETSETARIMLVSLVPFIIILIPKIFDVSNSSGEVEHELLVFDMLQRMQEHISKPLVTEGGAPNEVAIRSLFKKMDHNGDDHLCYLELKELLEEIKLSKLTWDWEKVARQLLEQKRGDEEMINHLTSELLKHSHSSLLENFPANEESLRKNKFMAFNLADMKLDEGDAAEKIMNHFDKNKNGELDVEEFIAGIKQWHNLPINLAPTSRKHPNEGRQMMMNEVDKSLSARAIATMLLVLGITILVLLVEPLIQSVQKFSASAGIPSFYVAFILVPLATNARTTISAIRAVSQKKQMPFKKSHNEQTTISLTFSEIYHGVLMNNILGMLVLSSIIYFRGLTWNFSFEVLIVLVVCATMGLLASFRSKFPIWTSFVAYMLYILSLTLVYILNGTLHSS
ncbi:Calcium-binding EF-hand [Cynara cardunculus var. scolymus]|uniref:Calcium-binding EF-hand n=1 Tax=Cynara cardunculus var. scolymus TaxID=59895 RepID=A0A103YMN3_CYNCS|nr:Calcium-binding EF-hand [Cynara cardunculus var. scolymus]